MKIYGRYIILAFLLSLSGQLLVLAKIEISGSLSNYIVSWQYGDVAAYPVTTIIPEAVFVCLNDFLPYLLFLIIFSTYIYRHFTTASIYVFSRCQKRYGWFFKEILGVVGYALLCSVMVQAGQVIPQLLAGCPMDSDAVLLLAIAVSITTLLLVILTLIGNLVSIYVDSRTGAIVSCGIVVMSMLVFLIIGEKALNGTRLFLYKLNPCTHLMMGWHSSEGEILSKYLNRGGISFPYWNSYVYLFTLLALVILTGMFMVQKRDFISERE